VSVEFRLYLIKEFQRLKDDESRRLSLAWTLVKLCVNGGTPGNEPNAMAKTLADSAGGC
jgi:hypothetical protein